MTAADDARIEAERRWPKWRHLRHSWDAVAMQAAFRQGADWQAPRDSAELTRLYAINEELAGQVQAAQTTIAAAKAVTGRSWEAIAETVQNILSRANPSTAPKETR